MKWMPIESAPKDREVLAFGLYFPFSGSCEFEGINITQWIESDGAFLVRNHDDTGELMFWNPTHWMPMPEPPSE